MASACDTDDCTLVHQCQICQSLVGNDAGGASPLQSVTWPEPVPARCNLTPHNSCNFVIVTQDRLGPDLTASFNYNEI